MSVVILNITALDPDVTRPAPGSRSALLAHLKVFPEVGHDN